MTSKLFIPLKEQDQRQLDRSINWRAVERWANTLTTGSLRAATKIVAASNSLDTAKTDADYVCSGSSDQTTINTALSALPAGGGKVLLLEGTYQLTGSVKVPANCTLDGMGAGTILFATAPDSLTDLTALVINSTGNDARVRITNLVVDCNVAAQTGTGHVLGIHFTQVTDGIIDNCWVRNSSAEGIQLTGTCRRVVVNNCHLNNVGTEPSGANVAGAISVFNSDHVTVVGCTVTGSTGATCAGFNVSGSSSYVMFTGCLADTITYVGFLVAINAGNSPGQVSIVACTANACGGGFFLNNVVGVIVSACVAVANVRTGDDSRGNGFTIYLSNNCILDGCVAQDNDTAGIMCFQGAVDCLIRDCHCIGNSQHGNAYAANIDLRSGGGGNTVDTSVMGCVCRQGAHANKPSYGLALAASVNTCVIVNNDLKNGGTTGAYNDAGTGTKTNLDGSANNWNRLA